jgi:hypothetical protein
MGRAGSGGGYWAGHYVDYDPYVNIEVMERNRKKMRKR